MRSPPRYPAPALIAILAIGAIAGVSAPASAADCGFPVTSTDATGTAVTIQQKPDDLVTLAPSAAQTLWEIGAKDRVIGVTTNADYLAGTDSLTQITTYPGVDIETVVNLTPDLVLAPNAIWDEDVEKLRDSGVTVYKFKEATTIEDVYDKTLLMGRLVGACDGARDTVDSMRLDVETARNAVEGRDRPRVFYHMGGGWTAGSDTFIHEIVTTGGGHNIAGDAGITSYAVINSEVLIREDPEWFIRAGVPVPDSSPYSETTAGRNDRVIVVDSNYINQPAPRLVRALETIVEALHPDVEIDLVSSGGVTADLTDDAPAYTSTVRAGGDVTLAVSGLYTDTDPSFTVPADARVNDDGIRLREVNLTLDRPNPEFELVVSRASSSESPSLTDRDAVTVLPLHVSANGLWPDDVARATLRFEVETAAVTEAGVDPGRLRAYRRSQGAWSPLDTTTRRTGNGTLLVTARTPGLGVITLGGPPVRLDHGETALATERLADGVRVTARASVENPSSVAVTRTFTLSVGDEVVTRSVTVPANASSEVRLTATVAAPGIHTVTLDNESIGEVTISEPTTETHPTPTPTDSSPAETPRSTPAVTTPTTGTATPGQPGFGVPVAVAAVLAAVLAAIRWRRP